MSVTSTATEEGEAAGTTSTTSAYSLITDVTDLALQKGQARPSAGNPSILEIPRSSSLLTGTGSTGSSDDGEDDDNDSDDVIRVGNILGLAPFSFDGKTLNSPFTSISVAGYLAVHDFNNRHCPFWKESERESQLELLKGCDFYLTMSFRDNELSTIGTGRQWMKEFFPPPATATAAKRIIQSSYAVFGPVRSVTAVPAAILGAVTGHSGSSNSNSTAAGIPTISPSATTTALDSKEEYPYFGRTIPTNRGEAEAFCFFMNSIGVTRFAILHVNDGYGTAWMASVVEAAQRYQMTVSITSFREHDKKSLDDAIQQLKAENLRYTYVIHMAWNWREPILALSDAQMMDGDYEVFFTEAYTNMVGTVLDLTKQRDLDLAKAINRTAGINLRDYEPRIMGDMMNKFVSNGAAVDHFLRLHRSGILAQRHNQSEAQHHNQSQVDLQNPHDLFRELVQSGTFPSLAKRTFFGYDAIWALGLATCKANRNHTSGPQIYESLKNLQFMGASGNVTFDKKTGSRDSSHMDYQVVNVMAVPVPDTNTVKITPVVSTIINFGEGSFIVKRPLIYANGGTMTPSPLRAVDENLNLVPNSIRAVCWALSALVVLCSVFLMIWTYQLRKIPRVRASQPIFLIVLCIGTFLMGLSIIFLTLQEPVPTHILDASCMVEVWLLFFGFSTTFAALFAKTWRIRKVYQHARSCRRVQIRAKDVLWPFAIVFTLNFCILTAWTVVDPLEWHRIPLETNQFGQVVESRGTCMQFGKHDAESAATSLESAFFWSLIAINGCAFLISTIESYRARTLPVEFNESLYVWMTNLIILESLLISIPVLFLVAEDPSAHMLASSLITTVFALAVLLPMFLPKMPRVGGTADTNSHRQVTNNSHSNMDTREEEGSSSRYKNLAAVQKISQYAIDVLSGARSSAGGG